MVSGVVVGGKDVEGGMAERLGSVTDAAFAIELGLVGPPEACVTLRIDVSIKKHEERLCDVRYFLAANGGKLLLD